MFDTFFTVLIALVSWADQQLPGSAHPSVLVVRLAAPACVLILAGSAALAFKLSGSLRTGLLVVACSAISSLLVWQACAPVHPQLDAWRIALACAAVGGTWALLGGAARGRGWAILLRPAAFCVLAGAVIVCAAGAVQALLVALCAYALARLLNTLPAPAVARG